MHCIFCEQCRSYADAASCPNQVQDITAFCRHQIGQRPARASHPYPRRISRTGPYAALNLAVSSRLSGRQALALPKNICSIFGLFMETCFPLSGSSIGCAAFPHQIRSAGNSLSSADPAHPTRRGGRYAQLPASRAPAKDRQLPGVAFGYGITHALHCSPCGINNAGCLLANKLGKRKNDLLIYKKKSR
jgi:hypothetical protein